MTRKRFAMVIIWFHLAAAALHGAAHGALGIPVRGTADLLVIAGAVYVGPLVALVVLSRDRATVGALCLSISMGAALIYGIAFHFVLATPDNVTSLPHGGWGVVFRATAALIAVLEALGVAAGGLLLLPHPAVVPPGRAPTSGGGSRATTPQMTRRGGGRRADR
jgi:hypothetical protein